MLARTVSLILGLGCFLSGAHAQNQPINAPKVSPVTLNVRTVAGDYQPLGMSGLSGARPVGGSGNTEIQTLVIEVINRLPQPLENLQVRYNVYKVTTTYTTEYRSRSGGYVYEKTPRESAPTSCASGSETISLRPTERKTITVRIRLAIPGDDPTRRVYDNKGRIIDNIPAPEDQIYGYIVEVIQNGEVVAERLTPSSLRNDLKQKRR